jgi:ABC-type nitrate/sulfonate/bicarbonate transport system permease component
MALPLAGAVGVLALFELLSRTELIASRHFPPVTDMVSTLVQEAGGADFWSAVGNTLEGWAIGLGLACAIAIPAGIVIGSAPLLHRALRGVIEFLRPIPSVALIPLAVLVYGSGLESKVFLATFAATWPLLMQTLYGVQDVDPVATDTARSFGFSRAQRLLRVTLPSAVPYIATGLRISSAVSLILAFTAELFMGTPGLGQIMNVAESFGLTVQVYALALATGFLGLGIYVLFSAFERWALRWHPSQREVAA